MKILVVFTGGTIGSAVQAEYISPEEERPYKLLELYKKSITCKEQIKKQEMVEFVTSRPYTLLSENLTGEYLGKLCQHLKEQSRKKYDGIIVTHGTDTLQYTAAALGYVMNGISFPVIMVSSNYILEDDRANGLDNFSYAVRFITQKLGKGVFVSYRNSDGRVYMHRGTRVLPHMPYQDDVYSVSNGYYGYFQSGKWIPGEQYGMDRNGRNHSQSVEDNEAASGGKKRIDFGIIQSWDSKVLRIFPYPGMDYPGLHREKAVLLDTYHSGTLCSITPSLQSFMEEAYQKKIPVFLTGAYSKVEYESVKTWEKLHIHVLPKASPVAMYMKLWLILCSKDLLAEKGVEQWMDMCVSEDFISE